MPICHASFEIITVQPRSTLLVFQILEISLIHNAEFIMLNDFAKPKALSPFSEYDISLCIHNLYYALTNGLSFRKNKRMG